MDDREGRVAEKSKEGYLDRHLSKRLKRNSLGKDSLVRKTSVGKCSLRDFQHEREFYE